MQELNYKPMTTHDQNVDKRKVCVVVTARPSYSRVKTAIAAIAAHEQLQLQLVVAASALLGRYGSVVDQIESDGFKIDEKVFMVLEGENLASMAKTTGLGVMELSTTFLNLKPDVVVTIADRYETIATAIAGAYMNIPVAHIQGGEVTGSIDEKVRHAVTKLADLHLVSTDGARARVIRLGESPDQVFHTGCPSIDLAKEVESNPSLDFDPFTKYSGVGPALDLSGGYIVVLQHPVTTQHEDSRAQVIETLEAIRQHEVPALWFWPNVDAGADGTSAGIRHFRESGQADNIHFFKNMAPRDFLKLLVNAQCLVGNSSAGIRECAFLGVPVVNIGSRQMRRERGKNVVDVAHNCKEIREAIAQQLRLGGRTGKDTLYGAGDAGERIAQVLATADLRSHKTITY